MMYKQALTAAFAILLMISAANAQKPELTITLNEAFFDALLDSVFKNFDPPEFSIAQKELKPRDLETQRNSLDVKHLLFEPLENNFDNTNFRELRSFFSASQRRSVVNPICKEAILLLRENNGLRTAVRFRDGKIYAPLAFSGNYSPPFVGCVPFSGYAETNIALEFDQDSQRLIARAKVLNVSLNGTGGVGGTVIAKLVQSAIDKKINPIEIIRMDKLSFLLPVQNGSNLRMKATGIRHEVENGTLKIQIAYEFSK